MLGLGPAWQEFLDGQRLSEDLSPTLAQPIYPTRRHFGRKSQKSYSLYELLPVSQDVQLDARLAHPIYTSIAAQNEPSSLGRAPRQSKKVPL